MTGFEQTLRQALGFANEYNVAHGGARKSVADAPKYYRVSFFLSAPFYVDLETARRNSQWADRSLSTFIVRFLESKIAQVAERPPLRAVKGGKEKPSPTTALRGTLRGPRRRVVTIGDEAPAAARAAKLIRTAAARRVYG